jgi:hypothetical protein
MGGIEPYITKRKGRLSKEGGVSPFSCRENAKEISSRETAFSFLEGFKRTKKWGKGPFPRRERSPFAVL